MNRGQLDPIAIEEVDPQPALVPAVFSVGVWEPIPYLFDLTTGTYHFCGGVFDGMLLAGVAIVKCGQRFRIVDDETATQMLASNPVCPGWCWCLDAAPRPPMLQYPRRLQR